MHRAALSRVLSGQAVQRLPSPGPLGCSPLARLFSVKEAGRTSGRTDDAGEDANAIESTVDELASSGMDTRAKVPFGAGPEAGEAGPGVQHEGDAVVSRRVASEQRSAPASRMEEEVAGGAERLKGTPRDDAGQVTPEGAGAGKAAGGAGGRKPLKGQGKGPRGWGAGESDSEAPPRGVALE